MTAEELNGVVMAVFGPRGDKAYTSALGTLTKHPEVLIGAIQGSPFKPAAAIEGFTDVRDGRADADTKTKLSERTGFHAEMLILSALINYLEIDPAQPLANLRAELLSGAGTITITADAPCCKHCGSMLDALGISYYGAKAAAGLTGWWNPLTDKVTPNGSPEFQKAIPGM